MEVLLAASSFASFSSSVGIMQLSVMTMARRFFGLPSSSTRARALTSVLTLSANLLVMLPLMRTGNVSGVTLTTAAPALKVASAALIELSPEQAEATRKKVKRGNFFINRIYLKFNIDRLWSVVLKKTVGRV